MIEVTDWYQLNSPSVVCDMVDDEVVFVNLDTGAYYSTEKVGAMVWTYIERGMTAGEILEAATSQYSGPSDEIVHNVRTLLEQLLTESLIVPGSGPRPTGDTLQCNGAAPKPFEQITLHKHSDMEDLLLLDPVHEVDDRGWPHTSVAE